MEEDLKSIVEFLSVDTDIRNSLITNIMQCGKIGIEEMSSEISKKIERKIGLGLSSKQISALLTKLYEYDANMYISDYDKTTLQNEDLFNSDFQIDDTSIEKANIRRIKVHVMVEELKDNNKRHSIYWKNFSNRGYWAIADYVRDNFGQQGFDKIQYYGDSIIIEELTLGITKTLNKVYEKSSNDLLALDVAFNRMDSIKDNNSKGNVVNYEAMFK